MPKNPFAYDSAEVPQFPRNPYDLTCNELFTAEFGQLIPVSTTEIIPGLTVRIKRGSSVGVRAMPTAFPVQTPIKGRLSWFYVRNRTLWKDWTDFIYRTKENLVHPFLKITEGRANEVATGSLLDYLGLSTTKGVVGDIQRALSVNAEMDYEFSPANGVFKSYGSSALDDSAIDSLMTGAMTSSRYSMFSYGQTSPGFLFCYFSEFLNDPIKSFTVSRAADSSSPVTSKFHVAIFRRSTNDFSRFPWSGESLCEPITPTFRTDDVNDYLTFTLSPTLYAFVLQSTEYSIAVFRNAAVNTFHSTVSATNFSWLHPLGVFDSSVISDIPPENNPFLVHSNPSPFVNSPAKPISALAPRAYEMICNYFFRNDLNNPYRINGQIEYNKFIPTDEGGADTNTYTFHYHNLELDQYTSCVQSPQFGAAPLVGLDYRVGADYDVAEFEFQTEGGDSYKAQLAVDPDTSRVLNLVNFDRSIPSANLKQLQNLVDAGFSINTLRNVNAFQRFKENQIRRGLRYRNQLKSHAGVEVDYPDIDVPQYLGGVSASLNVGQVNNMSQTGSVGLGDYIGTLSGVITMEHDINIYCPEHGFVIGIFSVSPTPVYSQPTAKYLLKTNPFDYFQQEFSKIGYVPVTLDEVAPLECPPDNLGFFPDLSKVFGYQRAWYDYMSKVDRVHGDFKTNLLDFTLARQFFGQPVLGRQFCKVNPEDYNHVFLDRNIATDYNSSAKFLLSANIQIDSLSQVPRHGTPSLE